MGKQQSTVQNNQTGEVKTEAPEVNTQVQETPEETIARLTKERDVAMSLAKESSNKLQKLEKVKGAPTVDVDGETYQVKLKKGKIKLDGNGFAKSYQFIKNEDGTVDKDHNYPNVEEWKAIVKLKSDSVLEKV